MLFSKKCPDSVRKYLLFMGDIVQYIHQKEKGKLRMGTILTILLGFYCMYLLSRKDYEKRYGKKLRFRDALNPKNWDKLH